MTAFEWLHQWDPGAANEEIRGLLGQMLFARDDGNKRTDVLSGGEAARLLFCKLMLQKPNVLVLDEPTNHLDLESINALNIALQRYQGTVLLVTHDHDLIDEVATRIWHFESDHQDHRLQGRVRGISDSSGCVRFRKVFLIVMVGTLARSVPIFLGVILSEVRTCSVRM